MAHEFEAVEVGSGPNGLFAAVSLAQAGWRVLVLEAASQPGGGLRTEEVTLPGFHHDICSAAHPLATSSPAFAEVDLADEGLAFAHSAIPLAHPLAPGRSALLHRDVARTAADLGGDGTRWQRLMGPMAANADRMVAGALDPTALPPTEPLKSQPAGHRRCLWRPGPLLEHRPDPAADPHRRADPGHRGRLPHRLPDRLDSDPRRADRPVRPEPRSGRGDVLLGVAGVTASNFVTDNPNWDRWTASEDGTGQWGGLTIGDRAWAVTPADATESPLDFQLSAGAAVLDLTELTAIGDPEPGTPGQRVEIDAGVGVGELIILVPADLQLDLTGTVDIGQIDLPGSTPNEGGDLDVDTSITPLADGQPAYIVTIDAAIGAGNLEVRREAA